MKMSNNEMMKLFDFILENKSIIISDNGLFSRDTLTMIRAIVKGRIPNDFKLTKEQEQLIIDTFINSNNSFNEDTPSFIMENPECVRLAIARDIYSIDYMPIIKPDLESYIVDEALKQKFVLKENSPDFLKDNFSVASNSIKLDLMSADYIDWYSFSDDDALTLIDEAIKLGYILSSASHKFLADNIKIVLESIKKDENNVRYASENMQRNPYVFKYLILNDYPFNSRYICGRALNWFLDEEVLGATFKKLDIYGQSNEKYIERFNKLYNDGINSKPLIKTFDSVFQYVAEEKWKEHRKDNFDDYDNIFGKICAELRNSDDFNDAINYLEFIDKMQETLGEKYVLLHQSMLEYYKIYHSGTSNKLEKMILPKDIIANLSALYVAKCKEIYKKERIQEYHKSIKCYFTLRIENPYVNKKLIQSHKKEQFINAYQNNDKSVCDFINRIVETYSKNLDSDIVEKLINDFVLYNRSKLNEIIRKPYYYDDYVRYQKAIKLINRLNSGYIQYDGVEVLNYRDIISLDNRKKQYVYIGRTFDEDDLSAYNEYRKRSQIFEKIKKDIMFKVQTIKFDGIIDEDLVEKLAKELPFTDEYFQFDTKYVLKRFILSDLIYGCMNEKLGFELDSIISDDSYKNVYNLLVNNGLMWLLVFNNNLDYDLKENGVNKYNIIEIINNMVSITSLAKDFKFDINNFSELLLVNEMSECSDNKSLAILGKDVIEKLYKNQEYTGRRIEKIIRMAKELVCQMAKRSKSTVPFVSGKYLNYNYSLYDSQDETILLAGIKTDSCFRIDGNDNDFLHYCALDKNGVVIKITDYFDNFIARASGFRNGNCVFINQLRTIYDVGGNYYNGEYDNEKNDIIETFKKACEDIVTTSQKNIEETSKINFVFVTQSYSLVEYESNVSDEIISEIDDYPMDTISDDWREFVENTNNLQEAKDFCFFTTDYGDYPLICMASSKSIANIELSDMYRNDVPALYERMRNKIIVTNTGDINIYQKVNKIKAIKSFFNETEFTPVEIPETSTTFIGDNWYIIYDGLKIIDCCLLDFDSKAEVEFAATKEALLEYELKNFQQQLYINEVTECLRSQDSKTQVKFLEFR